MWWRTNFKASTQSGANAFKWATCEGEGPTSGNFFMRSHIIIVIWTWLNLAHTQMIFPLCIWSRELSCNNHWEVEMPPSLSRGEPPPSMLITRPCLAWLLLAVQRAFLRNASLPLPNYWPGREECGFCLPQTPASRMQCLNRIFCHLLCPLVPGDPYHALSLLGRFLNSCLKKLPQRTHVHGLQHVRMRTHSRAFHSEIPSSQAPRLPWTSSIQLTLPTFSSRYIRVALWNRAGANTCPTF